MSKKAKNLPFLLKKIGQKWSELSKIANGNFFEKYDNFWQFFGEKWQVFGNLLTFKWQFSGGSGQKGGQIWCQTGSYSPKIGRIRGFSTQISVHFDLLSSRISVSQNVLKSGLKNSRI